MVLEFLEAQVWRLALWFGLLPLAVLLFLLYVASWIGYRLTRQAVSPVVWLAGQVRDLDPMAPELEHLGDDFSPTRGHDEVLILVDALQGLGGRIREFVDREKQFTRDASHELRSPLTVIKVAADVLAADGQLEDVDRRRVEKIRRSARDMESLMEALLILARESDRGLPEEDFLVNDLVQEEVHRCRPLVEHKPVEMRLVEDNQLLLHGPPRVVSVMLGNLLRNACNYTEEGQVTVRVRGRSIIVEDTGVGMDSAELATAFQPFVTGHKRGTGVGLAIVRRLSDRFGWPVELDSTKGEGTRAEIRFSPAVSREARHHDEFDGEHNT